MGWRVVHISNPGKLGLYQDRLMIEQAESVPVPIEDIDVLIVDTYGVTITTQVLARLAQSGVTVVLCDEHHLPVSLLMPYAQHSRQLRALQRQLGASAPLQKRLWQHIVQTKIANQAAVLDSLGLPHTLRSRATQVQSGDPGNVEAAAAGEYFRAILANGATRRTEDRVNSALNYGYALVRSHLARLLAGYGFTTAIGLHHHSELNPYNLADDLIEPFRPIVDAYVLRVSAQSPNADGELPKAERLEILDIFAKYAIIGGKRQQVRVAADIVVSSLVSALEQGDASLLVLPQYHYEQTYAHDANVRPPNSDSEGSQDLYSVSQGAPE